MKGFVLPIVLLLLVVVILILNTALHELEHTTVSLSQTKDHMQLLRDSKIVIAKILFSATGYKSISCSQVALAHVVSSTFSETATKLCESKAFWLEAELTWHTLQLRVSSRWAKINNDNKFCSSRQLGWQQTQWKEF